MHLLPVTTVSLDETDRAVDLGQTPGDVVVLSFADSDLGALASAYGRHHDRLPSLRLASLKQLRHPLSVDLYAESVIAKARFVLVRCLGGVDYWRYGLERLSGVCRAHGVMLAVLPGDDRPDRRLQEFATAPPALADELERYFHFGGVDNLGRLLRRVAGQIGWDVLAEPPRPAPRAFVVSSDRAEDAEEKALARLASRPYALLIIYRSAALSGDTAPSEALAAEMERHGVATLTLAVSSLKDPEAVAVVERVIAARRPDVIVTTTAFSARDDQNFVLDRADCPILQAITAGTTREAWEASSRGLGATDLAMQIVLPEFDGRLAARPIAFKAERAPDPTLGFSPRMQAPDADGIADVAAQALAWIRLAGTRRAERRLALILSDYPARGGRAGFAVGLDTPASACAILDHLAGEGYDARCSFTGEGLMRALTQGEPAFAVPLHAYAAWLSTLSDGRRSALAERWGAPQDDPAVYDGAFRFRAVRAGNVLVALQPDRGRAEQDRKAGYHDPDQPPCHAYLAFYLGLRAQERTNALIHLGTHGTTEWLPGKAVAPSRECWPQLAMGPLPVIYPFIVDDPGEAAPAKRRIGAVTIGHLPPPVGEAGLSGEAAVLRELVEEFSSAQVLDPRRADIIAREIFERADAAGLAAECGVGPKTPIEDALTALDAHLCDLAEVTIRDGLHVFGAAPPGFDGSSQGERDNLVRALDGRFVPPGPAGSPWRGRRDVLPTGRNLTTLDPRAIPTRSAAMLGERAAAEIIRRHLQDHGDYPRSIVMDLWASPTLRTGGEDIAHALFLMGARPLWDHASTRVTGFAIIPQPLLDHPRMDVTVRISGAFRDTFATQIALIDGAARAIARLDEDDEWNALAAARRRGGELSRVFGAAPGRYGAGVAREALDGSWQAREDLARAYLDNTSRAFGPEDVGIVTPSFAERVAAADAFVHVSDVRERDILDGDAAGDAMGGFAAAAESLGRTPALYSLDASGAEPKARTLAEDIARLARGRLTNPRWIEGQLRHGFRGAAELAQAVDALFVFAAATGAVTDAALDAVYAAYVADPALHERIRAANPAAAQAIVDRLAEARRRGLWTSRRNSIAADLDFLAREAAE